jgi:hypothetical protein
MDRFALSVVGLLDERAEDPRGVVSPNGLPWSIPVYGCGRLRGIGRPPRKVYNGYRPLW